jgi:5-methylcytosine-specific restriction enzyme B
MARSTLQEDEAVYRAAERWIDAGLRSDDSLFTPGQPIWAVSWLNELHERFVVAVDESSDRFEVKLQRQLAGAPPQAVQLMAEVLFVHVLVASPDSIKADTKRKIINDVLRWMPEPVQFPSDLEAALDGRLAATGTAFNTFRPFQLHLIIAFAREWKTREPSDRETLLRDPWAFREFLYAIPLPRGAQAQREALLHLVHPDTFEQIVSQRMKKRIAQGFAGLVSDPTANIDRQLFEIRERLAEEHGPQFQFWDDEIRRFWQPDTSRWGQFIHWVERFYNRPEYGPAERDYKIVIAERIQAARDAVTAGQDWFDLLKKAFGSPNNLTSFWMHSNFLKWCETERDAAHRALLGLWGSEDELRERIRTFLRQVPDDAARGRGQRTSLVSFLLMGVDFTQYPVYQARGYSKAFDLVEYGRPPRDADEADAYLHALGFLDELAEQASSRGLVLTDRLDAQSVLWCVVQWPIDADDLPLTDKERAALRRFRGGEVPDDEDERGDVGGEAEIVAEGVADLDNLAAELLIDPSWMAKIEKLLKHKGQVIFYGPPGTGKTYVAQKLATALAGHPGRVELVQFHPSYAYEDFVEGYRPSQQKAGAFDLRRGPLRRIAAKAADTPEETHVLVIDEINRGNVAKVFGELYFLLEYRDKDISLQYSDNKFSLPENLWIIGTMNTSDRTIALLDAALRRRFHFVPFFPSEEPIEDLLRRWLSRNRPEFMWVADMVDHANEQLVDRNLAIGPSHFLRFDLSEEWVELIWDHSIVPYIQEHFYGEPERWKPFAYAELRRRIAGSTASQPEDANASPATD